MIQNGWHNKPIDGDLIAKWIVRLILLIGLVFILKGMHKYFTDRSEVYKNRGFITGVIIDYGKSGRSGYSVNFKYYVNGKLYENNNGIDRLPCKICIGLKYKVIYSKKNPEKSFLLATKKQFKIFDLEIPEKMEVSE